MCVCVFTYASFIVEYLNREMTTCTKASGKYAGKKIFLITTALQQLIVNDGVMLFRVVSYFN